MPFWFILSNFGSTQWPKTGGTCIPTRHSWRASKAQNKGISIAHAYQHIVVHAASVITIWDTREPCWWMNITMPLFALYSYTHHDVMKGRVLQLACYKMHCGSTISHCEFFWRVLRYLHPKILINVRAPHNLINFLFLGLILITSWRTSFLLILS